MPALGERAQGLRVRAASGAIHIHEIRRSRRWRSAFRRRDRADEGCRAGDSSPSVHNAADQGSDPPLTEDLLRRKPLMTRIPMWAADEIRLGTLPDKAHTIRTVILGRGGGLRRGDAAGIAAPESGWPPQALRVDRARGADLRQYSRPTASGLSGRTRVPLEMPRPPAASECPAPISGSVFLQIPARCKAAAQCAVGRR